MSEWGSTAETSNSDVQVRPPPQGPPPMRLPFHLREDEDEQNGIYRMTQKWFKRHFRENWKEYYSTFHLNEKLYLHYKGFKKVENLEWFPDLRCIYLEGNGLESIGGLEANIKLRSLMLQENVITKMENLQTLENLVLLNLNDNMLNKIEGLECLHNLETLQVKRNRIGRDGLDDVRGILDCPSIGILDIQENCISDPAILPEILEKMPNLGVLYLMNNPCTKEIKYYKKTVISRISSLKYLDDRPVFEDDRRYAEAFNRGGFEEERNERKQVKIEKDEKHDRCHDAFKEMIRKAKEKRVKQQEEGKLAQQAISSVADSESVREEEVVQKVEEIKSEKSEEEEQVQSSTKVEPAKEEETSDLPPSLEEVTKEDLLLEAQMKKIEEPFSKPNFNPQEEEDHDIKDDASSEASVQDEGRDTQFLDIENTSDSAPKSLKSQDKSESVRLEDVSVDDSKSEKSQQESDGESSVEKALNISHSSNEGHIDQAKNVEK